jgi:hypothetical protein
MDPTERLLRELARDCQNSKAAPIDRKVHEGKKIVSIDIGMLCRLSLPCSHDCTVTYEDGEVSYPWLGALDIVLLLAEHGLPPNAHLDECMRQAAARHPEQYGNWEKERDECAGKV